MKMAYFCADAMVEIPRLGLKKFPRDAEGCFSTDHHHCNVRPINQIHRVASTEDM